jgi:hypothetical protein
MKRKVKIKSAPVTRTRVVSGTAADLEIGGAIIVEGDFDIEELDTTEYVNVVILSVAGVAEGASWTYSSSFEPPLKNGDLVQVPFGAANRIRVAVVTDTGVDAPRFATKAVAARLNPELPAF